MKSLDFQSRVAADAVPGLLALVRDQKLPWYTRRQAALTLGRIGQPAQSAVPVLSCLLVTNGEIEASSTTQWAAKSLSLFGPVAAEATPALVTVLDDDQRPHLDRLSCVEALARIGGAHGDAIPALIELARTEPDQSRQSSELRQAAVDGLALVGSQASPAVPTLIRLTRTDSGPLRKKTAVALGAIGRASEIAAEALAELVLFDDLPEVRTAAASSLATIGDDGTAVLRKLLRDEDSNVRLLSASALGRVLRTDDAITHALATALQDAAPTVRIAVAESLWQTTEDADAVIPTILTTLTSDDRQLRIRAYRLLITLGSAAEPALPKLRHLANDDRPHVRQVATKALRELGHDPTD